VRRTGTARRGGPPDDDSPDGTSDVAFRIAASDRRMRCLRRVNRTGLAGAVIEGWMASSADYVAVIDGDLQHDETILPKMYDLIRADRGELAIGTRIRDEAEEGLSPARRKLSDLGKWVFQRIAGTEVADPMSGFFMIRREIVAELAARLSPDGFKILVDVVLSAGRDLRIVEVPYRFRSRIAGESKLTPLVGLDFLGLVAHHATGGVLPVRFVVFALVGLFGLAVHVVVLTLYRSLVGPEDFQAAQAVATIVAMTSNFLLNNEITYRTHRYRGFAMVGGFAAFALACGVGAFANIDVASMLYRSNGTWWLSGLSGAMLSVVWNYAVSSRLIWRPRSRR